MDKMDNVEAIREKIRSMILTNLLDGQDASTLKDDISLERAHIVDSVRALEIIVFVEETWGITVENDDAVPENFDSVNNIVNYVHRKVAG
jgi:acyl carrier protein